MVEVEKPNEEIKGGISIRRNGAEIIIEKKLNLRINTKQGLCYFSYGPYTSVKAPSYAFETQEGLQVKFEDPWFRWQPNNDSEYYFMGILRARETDSERWLSRNTIQPCDSKPRLEFVLSLNNPKRDFNKSLPVQLECEPASNAEGLEKLLRPLVKDYNLPVETIAKISKEANDNLLNRLREWADKKSLICLDAKLSFSKLPNVVSDAYIDLPETYHVADRFIVSASLRAYRKIRRIGISHIYYLGLDGTEIEAKPYVLFSEQIPRGRVVQIASYLFRGKPYLKEREHEVESDSIENILRKNELEFLSSSQKETIRDLMSQIYDFVKADAKYRNPYGKKYDQRHLMMMAEADRERINAALDRSAADRFWAY